MPIQFLGFCWGLHLSTARAVSTFHFLTARAVSFPSLFLLPSLPTCEPQLLENRVSEWTDRLIYVQTSLIERKTAQCSATRAAT